MARMIAGAAVLTGVCGLAMGADDFGRLAPPDAGLVVCVSDYAASKERLLATPLGRLIEEPAIAEMIEEARKAQMESFEELATELGIDVEEWPEPAGMIGLALMMTAEAPTDEWSGPTFNESIVAGVDFGEGIAEIRRIVDAVVEKGLDQGLIEIETQDVGGVEVLTIDVLANDGAPEEEPDFENMTDAEMEEYFERMNAQEEQTGLAGLLGGLDKVTLAIDGSTIYLGTHADGVMDLLDRARGADVESLADTDEFGEAMAQHPEGTTDYVVLFPQRMGMVEGFGAGMGFFLPGIDPAELLANLGITGMRVVSVGLDLESRDAQAELTLGVLDHEKSGLVSLLDIEGEAWEPPAFVTPDAAAATRLLVDFPRMPEVLREFWGTMPPELQEQGGMAFENAMVYVEQIAPLLGPEVHMVQTMERPLSAQSGGVVYAIPTSNETPLNNLLVLASSNGALTARDFGDTKVYDMPEGMGVALSVAVGYGHLFIGMAPSVENALRLAGSGGGEGLAEDPAFQDAMAPHAGTGNLVQFTRTLDSLEYWLWTMQNMEAITRQTLLDAGWTEEEIEEYGMGEAESPEWAKNLTIDMFEDAVGDVSLEIAPSADGFRGRVLLHEPR